MKVFSLYWVLAICIGISPAAVGQTPQKPSYVGGPNYLPSTPEKQAKLEQASQLAYDASVDLHTGRYAQAEVEARQSLLLEPGFGVPAEVLAAA